MTKIVFASNNAHKLEEIREILRGKYEVLSLADIGCTADIPETANTFRGNAMQKAQYVYQNFGYDCFADDSGLEVDALGGEPGVFSARYAARNGYTPQADESKDALNIRCLLDRLGEADKPSARFRTAIALIIGGEEHYFDGTVEGHLISTPSGSEGFGYDPIFVPEGYDQTFAQLGADIKNGISHRARAVAKLAEFLD